MEKLTSQYYSKGMKTNGYKGSMQAPNLAIKVLGRFLVCSLERRRCSPHGHQEANNCGGAVLHIIFKDMLSVT